MPMVFILLAWLVIFLVWTYRTVCLCFSRNVDHGKTEAACIVWLFLVVIGFVLGIQ